MKELLVQKQLGMRNKSSHQSLLFKELLVLDLISIDPFCNYVFAPLSRPRCRRRGSGGGRVLRAWRSCAMRLAYATPCGGDVDMQRGGLERRHMGARISGSGSQI